MELTQLFLQVLEQTASGLYGPALLMSASCTEKE